jgi:hypothetical protein
LRKTESDFVEHIVSTSREVIVGAVDWGLLPSTITTAMFDHLHQPPRSANFLPAIAAACPRLARLDVEDCGLDFKISFKDIGHFKRLEMLRLRRNNLCCDEQQRFEDLPAHLRRLDLTFNSDLDAQIVGKPRAPLWGLQLPSTLTIAETLDNSIEVIGDGEIFEDDHWIGEQY